MDLYSILFGFGVGILGGSFLGYMAGSKAVLDMVNRELDLRGFPPARRKREELEAVVAKTNERLHGKPRQPAE